MDTIPTQARTRKGDPVHEKEGQEPRFFIAGPFSAGMIHDDVALTKKCPLAETKAKPDALPRATRPSVVTDAQGLPDA